MVYRRIQHEEVIWSIDVSNSLPITIRGGNMVYRRFQQRRGNMVYRRTQQEQVIWSIDVSNKRW